MQNEARPDEPVESQLEEVDDECHEIQESGSSDSNVDHVYTKRVMDDLDALLADLQSTTANISSYQNSNNHAQSSSVGRLPASHDQSQQQQQQQHSFQQPQQQYRNQQQPYAVHYNGNGRYNDTGLDDGYPYQQQQQPQQHSTEYLRQFSSSSNNQPRPSFDPQPAVDQGRSLDPQVVKRVSYASSEDGGGGHSGSSTPPPLPPPPPSEVLDSLAYVGGVGVGSGEPDGPVYEQQAFPGGSGVAPPVLRQGSIKGRGERMSALSSNLSELDQLLQDLNSAQFMAEVDRKSSNINEVTAVVNGGSAPGHQQAPPPAVAPKPLRGTHSQAPAQSHPPQRTSVDNLLDELEGAAPQPGRFPVEPVDPHYQELSTVTTHYNQNRHVAPQPQQTFHHSQPVPQQQHHLQPNNSNSGGGHYLAASSSSTSSSSSYHHPQTASTATRELDELMNSLSEFKLQTTDEVDPEPAYAKPMKSRNASNSSPTTPQRNLGSQQQQQQQQPQEVLHENGQLESMLGDLQSDMSRQGVNTKQKGVCAACQKPIVGQVIAALGKTWHVEHFVCAHCEEPLGTRNFYERDSMAYCETDYHHLFAPRCAYCNGPIVDKCIEALSKMWHPEHFFCAQCGRPFGEEDFHEKNGQAYCKEDYFQMFAPKCGGCALPIMENYISALNRQWHPECFVCWDCRAQFGAGSFFDYEGLPYCETHYHAKKGSLCASCEKPITGRCITAMFKKFHPEHFVCAFCLKQLNKGTFKEQNDKPYCHPCFVKLFG